MDLGALSGLVDCNWYCISPGGMKYRLPYLIISFVIFKMSEFCSFYLSWILWISSLWICGHPFQYIPPFSFSTCVCSQERNIWFIFYKVFFPSVLVVLHSTELKDKTLKNVPTIQMLGLSCVKQENDLRFL